MFGTKEARILQSQVETSSIQIVSMERKEVPFLHLDEKSGDLESTDVDCLVVGFQVTSSLGNSFVIFQEVPLLPTDQKIESVLRTLVTKSKSTLRARLGVWAKMLD